MGVKEDRAEGLAWLRKSAAQDFQPAKDALLQLAAKPPVRKP
jgi:hypothetical protein